MRHFLWFSALLLFGGLVPGQAQVATIDFPLTNTAQSIEGVNGPLVVSSQSLASVRIPFAAQAEPRSLALTFYFTETSGFLRLVWEGRQSETICSNLYEGTGLSGQRTIILSAEHFQQPGQLVIQSGGIKLGIERLRLAWLQEYAVWAVSAADVPAAVLARGETVSAREVTVQLRPPLEDSVQGSVFRAVLLNEPMALIEGMVFPIQLPAQSDQLRFDFWVSDLPLTSRLRIICNDQILGESAPAVPDLADPGYVLYDGVWHYVGWRPVSIYLDGSV